MNWQLALAIPITFTGFLILLESIEDMLNHCEGGAGLARPQKPSFPTLVPHHPAVSALSNSNITTRVEWPLPWATLEVEYSDYLTHMDSSPRLVDRSHIAQLPLEREASGSGLFEGAFSHLQGVKVRDMEECY
ncbi:hypothetical protein NADE_003831 [Nannochloris sp. 'desiccata']|nr:hypothetical protein KSW81_003975 [Chlorella desiccata (nom. nud.)]KAH7624479.1 hypothetical protein NADE_003831 [Chlorella desiccata (nom. nud.)]